MSFASPYRFLKKTLQLDFRGNFNQVVEVYLPVSGNGIQETHKWLFKLESMDRMESMEGMESNPVQNIFGDLNLNCHLTYNLISLSGKSSNDIKYEKSFYEITIKYNGALLVEETRDLIAPNYNQLECKKKLRNISKNKLCDVVIEITLQSYQTSLKTMLDCGRLTDVVIKTKDREFPCHKLVLATASDYFDKMFDVDMKENNESVISWVDVVDSTTVQDLLDFIYTGQSPTNIRDTCLALLQVSHMCLMEGLKSLCVDQLKKIINVENMGDILKVAVKNECGELQQVAVNFIVKNYDLKKGVTPPPWENLEPQFGKSLAITILKAMITKKLSL